MPFFIVEKPCIALYTLLFFYLSLTIRKNKIIKGEIMLRDIKKYIDDHQLIDTKQHIIVGVSGGADSMCLLHILKGLQKDYQLQLTVAHVNHGLRQEAKEDAAFVEGICKKWGLPYREHRCNIVELAKQRKCSEEVAGRNERYDFFELLRQEVGAHKIAVAHTMNDQAETMLMRLIRGSGMRGLGAMLAQRDRIIRPLLIINREEVEAYCHSHGIDFKEDHTNKMDLYTRNKLRRHVLPLLKKEFNPQIIKTLAQTADQVQETEAYLEIQTEIAYRSLVEKYKTGYSIKIQALLSYHPVIQGRVIRMVISNQIGSLKNIHYQHIEDVLGLFHKQSGKMVHIGNKTVAIREHEYIRIIKMEKSLDYCVELVMGSNQVVEYDKKVLLKMLDDGENKQRHGKTYTKNIDYDKISGNLQIRNRKEGDRILLKNGSKKLKDFFIDEKIPRTCRDDVLLIADERNIIWIIGYRLSEAYYVTDETKRILEIQIVDLLT